MNDYASGSESGAITPDNLLMYQDAQFNEYREKLERALKNDAPILELVI